MRAGPTDGLGSGGADALACAPLRALCPCTLSLLAAALPAQRDPTLGAEVTALREQLRQLPPGSGAERVQLLRTFLRDHDDVVDQPDVLQLRLQLGRQLLRQFDARAAAAEFREAAARLAGRDAELHGCALYGLHQAQCLLGERDQARASLRTMLQELDGKPLGDCARVALQQLDRLRAPTVGAAMPVLQSGRDVRGQALADTPGPRLFVFWSLEHAPSERRLVQLAHVWQKAGMPIEHLVSYALESDARALRRQAEQHDYAFTIVPGEHGFLHPDWLALGVTAVPDVFFVGQDGTLLARDMSPDRLAALLAAAK